MDHFMFSASFLICEFLQKPLVGSRNNTFEVGTEALVFSPREFRKISQDDWGKVIEKVARSSTPPCVHVLCSGALRLLSLTGGINCPNAAEGTVCPS